MPQHESEAHDAGLILVGKSERGSGYRKYQFKECKHHQDIFTSDVRRMKFGCKICRENKIIDNMLMNDFILISKIADRTGYYKCIKPCGCEDTMYSSNILRNRWSCNLHKITMMTKPSKIYLVRFTVAEFSWLKLGHARDISHRLKTMKFKLPFSYELLREVEFSSRISANKIEASIHSTFKSYRINPGVMYDYINSGTHECYPVDMLDRLYSSLDTLKNC